MFGFLRKSVPAVGSLEKLGVDMHAHWLPGIDDGAQNLEESLKLIRGLVGLGYRKLIATPHVMSDLYPNTPGTIMAALGRTQQAVTAAKINVELAAAAEYLIDDGFVDKMQASQLLTLPDNHVLVEFSFIAPPPTRDKIFFELLTKGYRPILAHPERYRFYHDRFEEYRSMAERGVKLQVNLLSLTGYYGKGVKKVAERLIDEQLVSLLGTDAHNAGHLEGLQKLVSDGRLSQPLVDHVWHNREWLG